MTNIMAAIMVLVQTNWTSIGTFTDTSGASFDVQQARLSTNTLAIIEFEHRKHEFTLRAEPGPVVGERKVPNTTHWVTNAWSMPLIVTNILVPYGRLTNLDARPLGWKAQDADTLPNQ